jgi:hypothetical protein
MQNLEIHAKYLLVESISKCESGVELHFVFRISLSLWALCNCGASSVTNPDRRGQKRNVVCNPSMRPVHLGHEPNHQGHASMRKFVQRLTNCSAELAIGVTIEQAMVKKQILLGGSY